MADQINNQLMDIKMMLNNMKSKAETRSMSNSTKPLNFIEVDSSYRDRQLWPNPAEFDVILEQTGSKDALTALDPVSDSSPREYWNSSFNSLSANNEITDITIVQTDPNNLGDNTIVLITINNTSGYGFRAEADFYDGAVLSCTASGNLIRRRILTYTYIGISGTTQYAVVTLNNSLPDNTSFSANCTIGNPSPSTQIVGNPQIFIPFGENTENYYINSYVRNINTGEYTTVIYYDPITHLAILNETTVTNWSTSSLNFVISDQLPSVYSSFNYVGTGGTGPNYTVLYGGTGINNVYYGLSNLVPSTPSTYIGSFLRVLCATGNLPTHTTSNLAPTGAYGQMERITNFITLQSAFIGSVGNGNVFTLDSRAVPTDNYYINSYLSLNNGTVNANLITSYTGATRTGTVYTNFSSPPSGQSIYIQTITLQAPFTVQPDARSMYEILPFTNDNFNPLSYNGSTDSSQQAVCYEVELRNLVLPNIVLNVGDGGRVAFYPYVYVELTPKDNPPYEPIWSNNPNAKKMMFRLVVSDTNAPTVTPFVRLRSDGMIQTIKFKPNTNFHFSVRIPSGEVFSTNAIENYSPLEPNPLIQVSAMFSIKRVS